MTDPYVRPREILESFSRLYPDAWKQVDEFRATRKELGDWADWCFLPLAATYAIVSSIALPWIRLRAYKSFYERNLAMIADAKKVGKGVRDLPQRLEEFKSSIDEFESLTFNKLRRDHDCPRIWALFAYILPRETRNRVFEPHPQEMLEDYVISRRSYRTKFARSWLKFAFAFRTALLVGECLRAMGADRLFRWVGRIVSALSRFR